VIVAIDIGNTFVKLARFQQGKVLGFQRYANSQLHELFIELKSHSSIQLIGVSDVTGLSESWTELNEIAPVVCINARTPLPFQVNYKTPSTLGTDRVCLVAGALKQLEQKQAALVIGMGTCITYDYITEEHSYVGGAISPGYQMRFDALHTLTKKLPLVHPNTKNTIVGADTNSSIESGVYQGIRFELEGRITDFLESNSTGKIFLTGGDAETFVGGLKNSIFADNFLLLKGINEIVEYQALHSSYSN
jgi:type III pantothenate kinase